MYRIVTKRDLTSNVKLFEVEASDVAKKARPGQFVIVMAHGKGERIPITIADANAEKGIVTIVFAEVGKTSKLLGELEEGEEIFSFLGPLGNAIKLDNYGTILMVGGGVMVGALHYQAEALKEAGNNIIAVVGARSSEHLIYVDEMKDVSKELYVATDDGSKGHKGLGFLRGLLGERKFNHVFTIGPTSLQKEVSEITKPHGIPTTVNLFPVMVDGMGMCGACRVTVGGETKFACVDGPDFDGHKVDFDELISRMRYYNPQEKIAMVLYEEES